MSARRVGSNRTTTATRLTGTLALHSAILALNPSVYGKHNEASGTTLTDYSGNGRNGTYSGVTLGATGIVGTELGDTAATYTGATPSWANFTYASWMDAASSLSLFAQVKTSASGSIVAILDRDDGSSNRVYQFRLNSGVLEFIKIGGTGGVITATASTGLANGAVHQLGATYDGSNIRLYVDGVKVTTTAAAGNLGTAGRALNVGINAGSFNAFSGTFSHWFSISGTVLADADYTALYASR